MCRLGEELHLDRNLFTAIQVVGESRSQPERDLGTRLVESHSGREARREPDDARLGRVPDGEPATQRDRLGSTDSVFCRSFQTVPSKKTDDVCFQNSRQNITAHEYRPITMQPAIIIPRVKNPAKIQPANIDQLQCSLLSASAGRVGVCLHRDDPPRRVTAGVHAGTVTAPRVAGSVDLSIG